MQNNKKIIKNLLATASTLAVLATSSGAAANTYYVDTGGAANPTDTTGAHTFTEVGGALGVATTNATTHTFIFAKTDVGHNLVLGQLPAVGGSHIVDLDMLANARITFGVADQSISLQSEDHSTDAAFGAGTDMRAATGAHAGAAVAADQIATLKLGAFAGTLSGGLEFVGNVIFDNHAASVFNITAEGTLASAANAKLTSGGANNGSVNINVTGAALGARKTVAFGSVTGAVSIDGGTPLGTLNVAEYNDLVLAGATNLRTNGFNGHTVVATNGALTTSETSQAGNVDATGTAVVTIGSKSANAAGTIALTNGASAILNNGTTASITLSGASTASVNTNATLTAATLNGTGVFTVAGGKVTTLTANAAANLITLNGGTVETLDAANTSSASTTVASATTVNQATLTGTGVNNLNFGDDVILTLGATGPHAFTAITATNAGEGQIVLSEDLTTKTIGTTTNGLNQITFATNHTIKVTADGDFNVGIVTTSHGAGTGKIIFGGTGAVIGTLGQAGAGLQLASVTVNGGKTVTFGNSLVNVAELQLTAANTQASLTGVGTAVMTLDSTDGGPGQVITLNSANAMTFAKVGATNAVAKVIVAGAGNVTVSTALAANAKIGELNFATTGSAATFTVDQINNIAKFTTASAKSGGTVSYGNVATTLAADFGATANQLTALNYSGSVASALDLNNKNVFGLVTANTKDLLTVNKVGNIANGGTYNGFGTADARLLAVNFDAANGAGTADKVTGGIFAKAVNLVNGSNVSFGGTIDGVDSTATGITFAGVSTASFADGVSLINMPITTAAPSSGDLTFAGTHTLGAIGTAANTANSIKFTGAAGKVVTLTKDIHVATGTAGAITFGAQTVTVTPATGTALTISGQTAIVGTTLNVGTTAVTLSNNSALSGAVAINATYDGTNLGQLVMPATSTLAAGGTVTLDVKTTPVSSKTVHSYLTFVGAGAALTAGSVKVTPSSSITKWTLSPTANDANSLDISVSANVSGYVDAINADKALSTHGSAFVTSLGNQFAAGNLSGQALAFLTLTDVGQGTLTAAQAAEAVERVSAPTSPVAIMDCAALAVASQVAGRAGDVAIGAGEEDGKMDLGVWASGFGSKSTQKARKGDAGYKGTVLGGSVGVDGQVNESTILGFAVSMANTELKFKNSKSGDKVKSDNLFFSVYGSHDLDANWFVRGLAAFGNGKVKSSAKRVTGAGAYDVASGKYDTMAFQVQGTVGYKYKFAENAAVTPMIGLKYLSINEGGYTEAGSATNQTITKKSVDKLIGIFGAGIDSTYDAGSGTMVTPELHAFVNYDFKGKVAKVTAQLSGAPTAFDVTSAKPSKAMYNVGTSVTAKSGVVEYGIGYDAQLANKYIAHQGTLRLKVDL